jgi:hypothetical protein
MVASPSTTRTTARPVAESPLRGASTAFAGGGASLGISKRPVVSSSLMDLSSSLTRSSPSTGSFGRGDGRRELVDDVSDSPFVYGDLSREGVVVFSKSLNPSIVSS